jgi:hypothetical protein
VVIPSPAATDFKVFALAAGLFTWPRFILSVAIGRGLPISPKDGSRWYGSRAFQLVHENYWKIGVGLSG